MCKPLSSVGLILVDAESSETFEAFVTDAFVDGHVERVAPPGDAVRSIPQTMAEHDLTFDDAYQYRASRHAGLDLVSFDDDLDDVPGGRLAPTDVLEGPGPPG